MTELRDQLRQARKTYEAAAYPGDLAAELLPPSHRPGRLWLRAMTVAAVAGLAVAATVTVALRPDAGPSTGSPAVPTARRVVPADAGSPAAVPQFTSLPDRVPLALPAGPLFPGSVPVSVSISGIQSDLSRFDPYPELTPWLRQQFLRSGRPAPAAPADPVAPAPATRQAV
ncbi:MAG TPA: hypothetical protein VF796_04715 [Humisphaera sp.]